MAECFDSSEEKFWPPGGALPPEKSEPGSDIITDTNENLTAAPLFNARVKSLEGYLDVLGVRLPKTVFELMDKSGLLDTAVLMEMQPLIVNAWFKDIGLSVKSRVALMRTVHLLQLRADCGARSTLGDRPVNQDVLMNVSKTGVVDQTLQAHPTANALFEEPSEVQSSGTPMQLKLDSPLTTENDFRTPHPFVPTEMPLKWYDIWPFFNLFHALLRYDAPSYENLERALNVLALVDALMLSVVITIPTAFSFEEVEQIDRRFSEGAYHNFFKGNFEYAFVRSFSGKVNYACTMSICYLSSSLLCVILLYFFSAFVEDIFGNRECFDHWWFYNRFSVLFALVSCIVGCAQSVIVYYMIVEAKFPDLYLEDHDGEIDTWSPASPIGFNVRICELFSRGTLAVTLVVFSLGVYAARKPRELKT
eukprot:gene21161-25414_t